jgi:hypothetical protein
MPVLCQTCKKVTWEGCGAHAEQVLEPYPPEQRCSCE